MVASIIHTSHRKMTRMPFIWRKKRFSVALTCCSLCLCLSCDVSLSVHCYVSRAERQNSLKLFRVLSVCVTTIEISNVKCCWDWKIGYTVLNKSGNCSPYFSFNLSLHVIYITIICIGNLYEFIFPWIYPEIYFILDIMATLFKIMKVNEEWSWSCRIINE